VIGDSWLEVANTPTNVRADFLLDRCRVRELSFRNQIAVDVGIRNDPASRKNRVGVGCDIGQQLLKVELRGKALSSNRQQFKDSLSIPQIEAFPVMSNVEIGPSRQEIIQREVNQLAAATVLTGAFS
jgi:hypothetical protein